MQITFHKVDDSFLRLITAYFKLSAFPFSKPKKLSEITCHIIVPNMDHFSSETCKKILRLQQYSNVIYVVDTYRFSANSNRLSSWLCGFFVAFVVKGSASLFVVTT